MRRVSVYKCPKCNKPFQTLGGWSSHVVEIHPEIIPKGYTPERYFYYILTGKTHGNCIMCKRATTWNDVTLKYNRFCDVMPECKQQYIDLCNKRIIGKYGKTKAITINANGKAHLLNNPDQQRKMVSNRSISGTYKFEDGGEKTYVGANEREFFTMLDTFLNLNSNDIMAPSPHTYYYEYKNPNDKEHEGTKFYIPDAYIISLNLEVEIKESTNMHPKIIAIDRVKEKLKDELMKSNSEVNYIKILDNNFSNFFEYFLNLKEEVPKEDLSTRKHVDTNIALESTLINKEDVLYTIKNYFNYAKAIAKCKIEKDTCIAKNIAWGPIDAKLDKMKFTDIANAVLSNPENNGANVKFIRYIEGAREKYDLIATKDIKPGATFKYSPSENIPEFFARIS